MTDFLDRIAQEQQNNDLTDVGQARHDYNWASTFNSTPPAEVLRARVNLGDTINRAFDNKLALQARSDEKALDLMSKTAQYREHLAQAPLREELLKARIAATGATERRKAEEARLEAEHTTNLNTGVLGLYKSGLRQGTAAFQSGLIDLMAANPHAHIRELTEIGKLAGVEDDPLKFIKDAKALKDYATANGFPNTKIKVGAGGKPVIEETAPIITPEQKLATDLEHQKQLGAARTEEAVNKAKQLSGIKPSDDTSKRLSHLETLRMKPNVDADVKAYLDSEISKLKTPIVPNVPAATPTVAFPAAQPKSPPVAPPSDAVNDEDQVQQLPAASTPHPFEGQSVRQKSTGLTGRIVNGQFVPR